MESQLRLAERRGVLTGPYLHLVQEYALEMLIALDANAAAEAKAKEFVDRVRASLVAGRIDQLPVIFPEWYRKDEPDDGPDLDQPEAIEWTVPESPDEIAFIEEFVRTQASGTVSAAELAEGGAWE